MSLLKQMLDGVSEVAIMGHLRPDGDCTGSCLGLYNYIKEQHPQVHATLYLEQPSEKFAFMKNYSSICSDSLEEKQYDLCIGLDSSDKERFGPFVKYFNSAAKTVCVDHHITNKGFAMENILVKDASSTCEVLYGLLDETKISKEVAECIYTGIIHDTGVFKFSNTSAKTMEIAGKLMAAGIDFSGIIDNSFYRKTYVQNQILGRALLESILFHEGSCIFSVVRQKDMDFYEVGSKDLDGIIDQLRITEGVECAIFMHETGNHEYKVSMRSNGIVDVSVIAEYFGGGGHVRAAGCNMSGSIHDVINNLSLHITKQLG